MRNKLREIRTRIGPLWWYGGGTLIFMRVADLVNFYISTILAPDFIAHKDLGAILPLVRIITLVCVPLSIISVTSLRFATKFEARKEREKTLALIRDMACIAALLSVFILLGLGLAMPLIDQTLLTKNRLVIWIIALAGVSNCWHQVMMTGVKSIQAFRLMVLSHVAGPFVRLATTLLLIAPLHISGYFLGILMGSVSRILFMAKDFFRLFEPGKKPAPYTDELRSMARYTLPIAIGMIFINLQLLVEPLIIRQRLSVEDSAGFFIIYNLGRIPVFLMSAFMPLILPIMSKQHEEAQPTHRSHLQTLALSGILGLLVTGLFYCLGDEILSQRISWRPFQPYGSMIWILCLLSTVDSLYITHSTHLSARSSFRYLYYFLPLVGMELLFLTALNMWDHLTPWLPVPVWQMINGQSSTQLAFFLAIFMGTRVLLFLCVISHALFIHKDYIKSIGSNRTKGQLYSNTLP